MVSIIIVAEIHVVGKLSGRGDSVFLSMLK